ncbi:MAG: autotransporter-associated beta strand repeat-containing protein, partial [Verrucomicrobiota bacterium]
MKNEPAKSETKKPRILERFLSHGATDATGKREIMFEALEQRVLYSAAPVEAAPEAEDGGSSEAFEVAAEAAPTTAEEQLQPEQVAPAPESTVAEVNLDSEVTVLGDEEGTSEEAALVAAEPEGAYTLDSSDLDPLVQESIARWQETGLTDEQMAALLDTSYEIADLGGNYLGATEGDLILIDDDAAGRGWFIDLTPGEDEEFTIAAGVDSKLVADVNSAARDQVDLLSILMHEQGHVLGLEDSYDPSSVSIMYGLFEEGERRVLADGEADGAVVMNLEGIHYAVFDGAPDGGGAVSGDINLADNYTGDTLPTSSEAQTYTEVIQLDGDAVRAINSGTTAVTVDVGVGTTLAASGDALEIQGSGVAFTVGTGGAGGQTLTLANDADIRTEDAVDLVQTIDANLIIGSGGTTVIRTDNSADTTVINGNIDGGTANEPILVFAGNGLTQINGTVGGTTPIQRFTVNSGTIETDAANLNNTGDDFFQLGNSTTSGTVRFTGSTDVSISDYLRPGNNSATTSNNGLGSIINDGSGVITFTSTDFTETRTSVTYNKTLVLGGSNAGANSIAGGLDDTNPGSGGTISLTKQDAGTWILGSGGDHTYSGPTDVQAGSLLLDGATLTGATAITVANGATFGGSGSVSAGTATFA